MEQKVAVSIRYLCTCRWPAFAAVATAVVTRGIFMTCHMVPTAASDAALVIFLIIQHLAYRPPTGIL